MRLDELLRVVPDDVESRSARARRTALLRLDSDLPPERRRSWGPAMAMAALCVLAFALMTGRPAKERATAEPEVTQPLRVHLILGDGTKVEWTFHEDFRL